MTNAPPTTGNDECPTNAPPRTNEEKTRGDGPAMSFPSSLVGHWWGIGHWTPAGGALVIARPEVWGEVPVLRKPGHRPPDPDREQEEAGGAAVRAVRPGAQPAARPRDIPRDRPEGPAEPAGRPAPGGGGRPGRVDLPHLRARVWGVPGRGPARLPGRLRRLPR